MMNKSVRLTSNLKQLLGDDANLKTKKTLECVDRFLKHANGQVIKKLLG